MFDSSHLVVRCLNLPNLNFNLSRFHGFWHLALQFDLKQSILKPGALDLDIVSEIEPTFERPTMAIWGRWSLGRSSAEYAARWNVTD